MSLDKAIQHGKEHRCPYTGAKAIDRTCRNHGIYEWCHGNRQYASRKKAESMKEMEREWNDKG